MSTSHKEIIIEPSQNGHRLDYILKEIFPNLSLRERKKLWDNWVILIDGKKQGPGFQVRSGQSLSLIAKNIEVQKITQHHSYLNDVHLLRELDDLIFLYKPSGLHSAKQKNNAQSLEEHLAEILGEHNLQGVLCNRLDAQTSGIMIAAKNTDARQSWQDIENKGQCQKQYIALVQGDAKTCVITKDVDIAKRKISRILHNEALALRHTHFQLLGEVNAEIYSSLCNFFPNLPNNMSSKLYLMACTIFKGTRHQIRAHAAYAGFPLFNDHRYQRRDFTEESFVLHHVALHLPHGHIYCQAPWQSQLPTSLNEKILHYVKNKSL